SWLVWDYRIPEGKAFDELEKALREKRAGFYLLYTAGLDSDLHRYGIGDEHIASRLSWYRDRIERICSIDKRARVIVLGDHGMCDVSNQVDVVSMVNSSGLIVPDDFVPFYDSTMARFRVFNERARGSLEELLSNCRQGRIVRSEDLDRLGVAFEDGRYGDLIFLVQPGSIILPSFMGTSPVASMHGYHPDAECMYSVMFTNADVPWEECSICDVAAFLVPGFEAGGEGVRCGD
ncbi:MAG: alkaline phosphatase family protein, partial [Candidatus Krumholzibacteria bacterium]|nr:alkaline phosphatase family protein [Candidatus Krumholzibacteria bacterium]